jgi:hypothetical protein
MTKGQFALLTAGLGLVTMGGAGYFAYASSTPHSSSSNGASAYGQPTGASGTTGPARTGGPGATSDPTSSGATGELSGGKAACQNGEIQVTDQPGQGAAGTISMVLVFQNVSSRTCTLHGYPGAELTDAGGADLGDASRALPPGLAKAPTVALAPGAQATALLLWSDVPTSSGCAGQKAVQLLVTPPNTTKSTALSISSGSSVCAQFRVRPVLTGVTTGQ